MMGKYNKRQKEEKEVFYDEYAYGYEFEKERHRDKYIQKKKKKKNDRGRRKVDKYED